MWLTYLACVSENRHVYALTVLPGLQEEAFLTYIDLDRLIEQTPLAYRQTNILLRFMEGYTVWDLRR